MKTPIVSSKAARTAGWIGSAAASVVKTTAASAAKMTAAAAAAAVVVGAAAGSASFLLRSYPDGPARGAARAGLL